MDRSRKERNRIFEAYEGLAEKAAGSVWAGAAKSLSAHGIELDDLRQQAKIDLLEMASSAKDVGGGFPTYVWKTLTGLLKRRFISGGVMRDLDSISPEVLVNMPDSSAKSPCETVYYKWMAEGSPKMQEFCRCILVGGSEAEARRAAGWTKAEAAEALARMRRALEREGWT